jgi:hypothetical protein
MCGVGAATRQLSKITLVTIAEEKLMLEKNNYLEEPFD